MNLLLSLIVQSSRLLYYFSLALLIPFVSTDYSVAQFDIDGGGQTELPITNVPEPPKNLKVEVNERGDNITFKWESAGDGKQSSFKIQLDPQGDDGPLDFFTEDTTFSVSSKDFLEPGRTYLIRIYAQFESTQEYRLSSTALEGNFTTKPNPPERFVVWYRNETSFLVLWQPPTEGIFDQYKAEISPRESPESTLFVSQEKYQAGEVRPGFFNLAPGRAYNISVVTQAESQESLPLVKEYRTIPLKPENVSVTLVDLKSHPPGVIVQWLPPPEELGDYDGFNVYIKRQWVKPIQKFVSRAKPPKARLEDPGLVIGETYEVVVKTVSGKVSSSAVSHNFTFTPNSFSP